MCMFRKIVMCVINKLAFIGVQVLALVPVKLQNNVSLSLVKYTAFVLQLSVSLGFVKVHFYSKFKLPIA